MNNIIMILCLIGVLFSLTFAQDLKYFSNFKPTSNIIVGSESIVTDFVTMTNKPGLTFPNEFTICTSLFIDIMTVLQNIVQILRKDGTPWFSISYQPRQPTRDSTNDVFFYCIQTGMYLSMYSFILTKCVH